MGGITKHLTAIGCPHNKEVSNPTVKMLTSVGASAVSAAVTHTPIPKFIITNQSPQTHILVAHSSACSGSWTPYRAKVPIVSEVTLEQEWHLTQRSKWKEGDCLRSWEDTCSWVEWGLSSQEVHPAAFPQHTRKLYESRNTDGKRQGMLLPRMGQQSEKRVVKNAFLF